MSPHSIVNRQSSIDNCPTHHQITKSPNRQIPRAFTLVEMLVVIAIIALLLAVLLPAFDVVRTKARVAATQGQYAALETGIATYRGENALGGGLPPSSGDNPTRADRNKIADPRGQSASNPVRVAGAHLLAHALMGADGLGAAGFKDLNRDSRWWNDTFGGVFTGPADRDSVGLYGLNSTTGETAYPRYGPYVDEKMRENTRSIEQLFDEGRLVTDPEDLDEVAVKEPAFVDPWGLPILYYKANPSALRMIADSATTPTSPGIYWQEDNAIITGSEGGAFPNVKALDFGTGEHLGHGGQVHYIHNAKAPPARPAPELVDEVARTDAEYEHTFARFIIDPSIKARPTPVRKDEYLLISAGPDSIYGSEDDVLNWTRKTE